jgi:uncharacterized protein YbbC (DUF1343 family)
MTLPNGDGQRSLRFDCGLDRLAAWLRGEAAELPLPPALLDPLRRGRWGLLTHAAAVDQELRPAFEQLRSAGAPLSALFGPEHGVRGAAAAGEHVASGTDPATGLPVYSLYGETRRPTPEMLRGLDVIVADLQDVGTRFYTYAATLSQVMEAAAEREIPVLILDRANPVGGHIVEGPMLEPEYASFVGPHPTPIRHGLTLGELARLFHAEYGVGPAPHVLPVRGWDGRERWPLSRPWAPPSLNIPTPDAALLYPGVGLLEGTNLSEGRGTTKPFEWVGAPWIEPERWREALAALALPGVAFRPIDFVPTTSKHAGVACGGVQVHLRDRDAVRSVTVGAALLATARHLWPGEFAWLESGGGFKVDRLAGSDRLRRAIDAGAPLFELEAEWAADHARFAGPRERALLYGTSPRA